jgi:hypothetical protein
VRGAEDIQAVDFLRGDRDGCPTNFGIRRDLGIETLPRFGAEFFGVIEPAQNKVRREYDCAYNDRAGEWSTTGFIDSCDGVETLSGDAMLVDKGAWHVIGLKEHRHQCRSGTMPMKFRMIRSRAAQTVENTPVTGVPPLFES